MKISKELLIELLNTIRENKYIVKDIDYSELEDCKIKYLLDNKQWYYINIYELAHKCKEYCRKEGFILGSLDTNCYIYDYYELGLLEYDKEISAETEIEAIFKATEYIIKNKEQNGKN